MRLPDWFRDRTIRKVAKYGVPAALGKFVNAISGLVTLAILTRYLGPGPFGVIAVIRTVVTLVDSYANFNTWQAIIKYGTEAIAEHRSDDVKRVIKLSFLIDASTAVIGALVVAVLAFAIPGRFGWSSHDAALCALYSITLVSKVSGTSDGIFRICDAYRVQAIVAGASAITMTGLVVVNSGEWKNGLSGAALTHRAFEDIPVLGGLILTVGLLTFVFSTILGWSYYGEKAAEYLFGPKVIFPYRVLWVIAVMVGSVQPLATVWTFSDIANGLMAVPNLIALLGLSGVVVSETREYLWSGNLDKASPSPS